MDPPNLDSLRMPGLPNSRWLGLWLPVLAFLSLYGLAEGLIHFLDFSEGMDVMADVLAVGAILIGAYFGSASIAKVAQRQEEESLQQRKQALASLERRFHVLNETSSDGVLLLNADGICRYASPSTRRLLGYDPDGLVGRGGFEFVHPDDRKMATDRFTESLQHPGALIRAEFRVRRQDGDWRWMDATIRNVLTDPSIHAIVNNYRDITDRIECQEALRKADQELKAQERRQADALASATAVLQGALAEHQRAEEELRISQGQIRASMGRLLSRHEEERARFSRELHEELGQTLGALKLESAWWSSRLPDYQVPLLDATRSMSALADSAIGSVRRIATELRPSILDLLGVVAALEWQAQEFEARTGIVCEFVQDQADIPLTTEVRTTLFRICQEILSNVARHARATHVRIQAREEADRFVLTVADNGRGISEQELASQTSLGLLGMREQALLLGGQVSILGRPGEGTTVGVQIPLGHATSEEPSEGQP